MNWLCILILAVPVLGIFNGLQRGMVRTALSLCSVIITLILGSVLNPYVSELLKEKTPVYRIVQEKCEETLSQTLEKQMEQQMGKEEQDKFIESLPLPESFAKILVENNNSQGYQQVLAQTFGEYLSRGIAEIVLSVISLILTFILVSIIINIAGNVLNGIFSLPVLSLINRAGGAVLGGIEGIFFVWIVFLVIALFWDTVWAKQAVEMIRENSITQLLYDNNILTQFLSGILS